MESKDGLLCSRKSLLERLDIVRPALGKGVFVPVLSHFCFIQDWIAAYDDSIGIAVWNEHTFSPCAVPGDLMMRLLGSLAGDELRLAVDGGVMHARCGRSHLKLPTMPLDAMIFDPESFGRPEVEFVVTTEFLEGVEACLLAVGVDPTHGAQMGVTLAPDELCLYSTDNVTMSRYALPPKDPAGDVESTIIMPTAFCQQLLALSRLNGSNEFECPSIEVHDKALVAKFGDGLILYGKLISTKDPLDFSGVFGRVVAEDVEFVKVPRGDATIFETAFERACAVVDPNRPVTTVSCAKDHVDMLSKSPLGEVTDSFVIKGAGTVKEFMIDPYHVTRALKRCGSVHFASSALVMCGDDDRFIHIISHCRE